MKKLKVSLIFIMLIWIVAIIAYANPSTITATAETFGRKVNIEGKITNCDDSNVVTLFVGSDENIIYIYQKNLDSDGTFLFTFNMPDSLPAGQYEYEIGSDTGAETFTGIIKYEGSIEYVDRLAFCVEADVIVSNYSPKLLLTIYPEYDNEFWLYLLNETDNKVIKDVYIEANTECYSGEFEFSNILDTKTYTLYLEMLNKGEERLYLEVKVDTDMFFTQLSANLLLSEQMCAYADFEITRTEQTLKSFETESSEKFSIKLPKVFGNFSAHIDASVYETIVKEPIENITSRYMGNLYKALTSASSVLDPEDDGVIELSELSQLTGILDLSSSKLTDIEALQYCTGISGLYLDNNVITDLSYISELDNLEILSVSNNRISKIDKLPQNLKILNINNNELTSVKGLRDCDKLEIVLANNNNIAWLMSLRNKPNLKRLEMKDNAINDISALENSNKLEHIELSNNRIENLDALSEKNHLKYLNLGNNAIDDVSTLPLVPYHILILSENNIDVSDTSEFTAVYKKILPQN